MTLPRPRLARPSRAPVGTSRALERRFVSAVRRCAERLGLELPPSSLGTLRVVPALEAQSVRQLVDWGLDPQSARFCRRQAQRGDSSFWPRAGLVLLARDEGAHMAEEAAHVLRHVLAPLWLPDHPIDAFYMRAVEEGLAFFASKLLCPRRPAPDWRALEQQPPGGLGQVARAARAHLRQESGRPSGTGLFPRAPAVADAVCHLLGYRLGDALYRAHAAGLCDPRKLRALFLRTTSGQGEACLLYWQMTGALRDFLSPAAPRYDGAKTPRQERRSA